MADVNVCDMGSGAAHDNNMSDGGSVLRVGGKQMSLLFIFLRCIYSPNTYCGNLICISYIHLGSSFFLQLLL